MRDQPFGLIGIVRSDTDADARREMKLVCAVGERQCEGAKQRGAQCFGLFGIIEADGEHHELISTETRDRILFADRAVQPVRDRA